MVHDDGGQQLWQQAAHWLVAAGVLEPCIPISQVAELAVALSDGVRLCRLANILMDGSIDNRDVMTMPDSAFLRERNIVLFVNACRQSFFLNSSDVFDPTDLTQYDSFERVLQTLSALSRTKEAQKKGLRPFPELLPSVEVPSTSSSSNDDIYCNLQQKVACFESRLYDVVNLKDEEQDDQIYNRFVRQPATVDDIWTKFEPKTKRDHVIKELLDTEANYLNKCLEVLMRYFYSQMKTFIASEDFKAIFVNIADIYNVHKSFHNNLRRAVLITLGLEPRTPADEDISIGKVFIQHKKDLLAYAEYCSHMKSARDRLDEIERKEEVTRRKIQELKLQLQSEGQSIFALQDALSVPFQRICKYHLFLKTILDTTDASDPEKAVLERALLACEDVVNYVNETKRDCEIIDIINSIERSVEGMERPPAFLNYGRFQLDGPVKLSDTNETSAKPKQRYVFVFERVLLICKKQKNSQYTFKTACRLDEFDIEEGEADTSTTLSKPANTITRKLTSNLFDTATLKLFQKATNGQGERTIHLFLKSIQERLTWKEKIKEAMERSNPSIGVTRRHKLIYESYVKPTNCDVCQKLLLGKFYQGYRCERCNRNYHYDCIAASYCRERERDRSTPNRSSDGILHMRDLRCDKYLALTTVNSTDPNVLSFEAGEEIIVFADNPDGTVHGRRALLPGKSGLIDRMHLRPMSLDVVNGIPHRHSYPQFGSGGESPSRSEPNALGTIYSAEILNTVGTEAPIEQHPWYFGLLTRPNAIALLTGTPKGTFIARFSVKEQKFVLSMSNDGDFKHMKVESTFTDEGRPCYYLSDTRRFETVPELVAYYRTNSLAENFDGLDATLSYTVLRTNNYCVIQDFARDGADANTKYLELRRGTIVRVIDTTGENLGWWRLQAGDKTGFFPLTYITAVESTNNENDIATV